MSWTDRVGGLLSQYSGSGAAAQAAPDVNAHFDEVAHAAPSNAIAQGLAEAFRSPRTASFSESVSNLFAQSNAEQKAGLLSRLIGAADPGMLSRILPLAGSLGASTSEITPGQAQNVSPDAVKELAAHAEQHSPSVIETVSQFYAQHPTLVKTLGATAVSILLSKVAERRQ